MCIFCLWVFFFCNHAFDKAFSNSIPILDSHRGGAGEAVALVKKLFFSRICIIHNIVINTPS